MTELTLAFLAGLAAGLAVGLALHLWACWRLSNRTGVPMLDVLRICVL